MIEYNSLAKLFANSFTLFSMSLSSIFDCLFVQRQNELSQEEQKKNQEEAKKLRLQVKLEKPSSMSFPQSLITHHVHHNQGQNPDGGLPDGDFMSEAKDWAGELISGQTGTGRILVSAKKGFVWVGKKQPISCFCIKKFGKGIPFRSEGIGRMVFFLHNFMIWLDWKIFRLYKKRIMGGKRIFCGCQKGKGVGHAINRICIESLASCTWPKNWSATTTTTTTPSPFCIMLTMLKCFCFQVCLVFILSISSLVIYFINASRWK